MDEKLKPCPFCKSENILRPMQDSFMKWIVGCLDCGAEGSQALNPAEAIAAWNTRSPSDRNDVIEECAAFLEGYAGGHYMAKICAVEIRARKDQEHG